MLRLFSTSRFFPYLAAFMLCAALPWAAWAQKVVLATSEGDITLELDREKAPRTVDNFIVSLRAKLEETPATPRHLITVRGSGYRLEP